MKREVVLAFALAGVATVGAVVLSATGHAVPPELWSLAFAGAAGGLGMSPGSIVSGALGAPSAPTATISSATIPLPATTTPAQTSAPSTSSSVSVAGS